MFLSSPKDIKKKDLFIFRARGRKGEERKGNIDVQEKHRSVAFRTFSDKTQACALTGNGNGHLSVSGMTPNPLSHTSQDHLRHF